MYADISQPAAPLPQPNLKQLADGISLLAPLSRRDHGPGLILLTGDVTTDALAIKDGVPSRLLKWAEEGYAVVEIQVTALDSGADSFAIASKALQEHEKCDSDKASKLGLVVYGSDLWNRVAPLLSNEFNVAGAVVYADQANAPTIAKTASCPLLWHLAGKATGPPVRTPELTIYSYPNVTSHRFADPDAAEFNYSVEAVSHSRNLTFIKPLLGGPYFDLEAIWEEHTYYEFADRSVEHTMSTMVQEPYVNHIPTLMGGVGRSNLSSFYRDHFIFNNSADTELELISRVVGIDRVVDEFIFKFTHDLEVDWLIPGIPPTGIKLEIPFTAIVNIRGDRLYHEHISWDQGTVLRQLGLLPEYLLYPYPLPDGKVAAPGSQFEFRVPVAGTETAEKLRDRNAIPSNKMLGYNVRERPL